MADLGVDIDCLNDLDPTFALVSGRKALGQAIVRRLITPRGSLLHAPDYGFDVRAFLNESVTGREIFQIESGIEAEVLKDERLFEADATVTYDEPTARLTIHLRLTDADGPFDLVLAVSALKVEDIQLPQAA